jgi:uncharacterized protein (TIGR02646 family)
MLDRKGYVVQ